MGDEERTPFTPERGTLLGSKMRYYSALLDAEVAQKQQHQQQQHHHQQEDDPSASLLGGPVFSSAEYLPQYGGQQQPTLQHLAQPPPHVLPPELFAGWGQPVHRRSRHARSTSVSREAGYAYFTSDSERQSAGSSYRHVGAIQNIRDSRNQSEDERTRERIVNDSVDSGEDGLTVGSSEYDYDDSVENGGQSSLVTVFSIWSAMMGASMLAVPFGFEQAGIAAGVGSIVAVGAISYYTVWLILRYGRLHGELDFADVAKRYLGSWAQWLALSSSVLVLTGGCIALVTLMSNALFKIGGFAHCWSASGSLEFVSNTHQDSSVCSDLYNGSTFSKWWNLTNLPILVAVIVFPLTNVKQVSPLLRLNSFGVVFMSILMAFIIYSSTRAIIAYEHDHDRSEINPTDAGKTPPMFEKRFFYLMGIADVAFFIHNAILPMTAKAQDQKKTARDVGIAFGLVALTYAGIGTLSYVAFWNRTSPISQDFIHMFPPSDIAATIARLALFSQIIGLYPLLLFVIRIQMFGFVFKNQYPSWLHIFLLNIGIGVGACLFGIFYPNIGTLFRFVGAFGAFLYVFCLPVIVHLLALRAKGQLSLVSLFGHSLIIAFGLVTLVWQFVG